MDIEQACRIFASCCNRLDAEELIGALHDDVRFESQRKWEPMLGKPAVAAWLRISMRDTGSRETLETSGVLRAELAITQEYPMYSLPPQLVVVFEYSLDIECEWSSTVFFKIRDDKISDIHVCIIPPPHTTIRSGIFPGLKLPEREKGDAGG